MYGNLPFNFVKKRKRNHHTTMDFFVEIIKNKVKKSMLQVCFCHNIYQSLKKLWPWDYGKFTTFSFKKLLVNHPTLMCLLIKNVKIFLIKIMRALYFSLSYRWWFFFKGRSCIVIWVWNTFKKSFQMSLFSWLFLLSTSRNS